MLTRNTLRYVADHVDASWMKRVWDDGDVLAAAPPEELSIANAQSCNFVLRCVYTFV